MGFDILEERRAVVLAGDKNYLIPILTTIKSILYYNQNVKIYIKKLTRFQVYEFVS